MNPVSFWFSELLGALKTAFQKENQNWEALGVYVARAKRSRQIMPSGQALVFPTAASQRRLVSTLNLQDI